MLLEYAEASFECMEHRFRHLRALACVMRVLQEYALANDMGLQFGDVPVGLVKLLPFHARFMDLRRQPDTLRVWAGPGPRPIELGRDPTASERALGKVPQPAPQLYRIWGLFPLNSDC